MSALSSPEPMSPGSPQSVQNASHHLNSPYLPGFLLGDQSSSTMPSPNLWSQKSSPAKNKSYLTKLNSSQDQSQRRVTFSPLPPSNVRVISGRGNADKHGGPPIQGLFDETSNISSSNVNSSTLRLNESMMSNSFNPGSSIQNASFNTSVNRTSLIDESQVDSFSTNCENDSATWITIYGFPQSAASFLLQQFSQYGTIIKHKTSDKGNWMHICYLSKLQAKRAISKDGKVIGGNMMVGVKLCDDKEITEEFEKENSFNTSNVSILRDSGMDQSRVTSFNRSMNIRPLTQAYRVSANERDVTGVEKIPQKTNSVISKAMDYVFGW